MTGTAARVARVNRAEDSVSDRAPINDDGAETVVLGALLSPGADLNRVDDLSPEDFYRPRHGSLFAALLEARDAGVPREPLAIAGWLADRGVEDFARLGGAPYLHECIRAAGTAGSIGYYVGKILDCADRRAYEAGAVQLVQAATTAGHTVDDLADMAHKLMQQAKPRRDTLNMTQLGSLINPCLDDIEKRPSRPAGITTGFTDLDRLLGGLRRKQLITVAAATGMGKSIFLVDVARHVSIRLGLTVAFLSLEMDKSEIFERIIAAEAGVPHAHVRDGDLDERDWQRISTKLGPMSNAPLFLADDAPLTIRQINARAARLQRQHGLDLLIVDHMHLVDAARRSDDEVKRLTEISRGCKVNLAMDLDVPVMAAAQLNRNQSARPDKRPQLSDLKNSSSIEQDSNVVIMIHRDDYYDHESPRAGEADFIVAKNRNGAKDTVTVAAQLYKSRFCDMAII
jgi:replicative DNA helicase